MLYLLLIGFLALYLFDTFCPFTPVLIYHQFIFYAWTLIKPDNSHGFEMHNSSYKPFIQ